MEWRERCEKPGGQRYAVCSAAASVALALVLRLVTLGQAKFSFAYSQNALYSNLVIMAAAGAAIALAVLLRGWFSACPYRAAFWRWLPFVWFTLLFCAQLLVARSIWFYPVSDPKTWLWSGKH